MESEDLVFTIESIVEKFGEEIAPYALAMTQQLVAAFWRYSGDADNAEDDDADDDMGVWAPRPGHAPPVPFLHLT